VALGAIADEGQCVILKVVLFIVSRLLQYHAIDAQRAMADSPEASPSASQSALCMTLDELGLILQK
jgi:hypothetical protein